MPFQTGMTYFLLWKTKDDILNIVSFHWLPLYGKTKTMDVNENWNCLAINILQIIFFCVQQKK